jgi:archaeal flagellar protein FlaJ
MIKIPFSFIPPKQLRGMSKVFLGTAEFMLNWFPFLGVNLRQAKMDIEPREYLSMCLFSSVFFYAISTFFLAVFLKSFEVGNYFLRSSFICLIIVLFVFLQQIMYPKLVTKKRIKKLEINLLAALQSMMVQLNSGVPLFDIMVNMSKGDYGEISKEFSTVVKEINTGKPQVEALEDIAVENPSVFFRRSIWQIVNGMKAGSDMSSVIKEIINSLSEEQVLQIQKYGGQLNPLAMFYMLVAVIAPTLGMTFLIVISSFISMGEEITKIVFWSLFGFVCFFQIMFLGIIKSRRPNLLGE